MRIGVAATPDVAIPTLDWLLQSEHSLELVITQPDKPAGRGRTLSQSIVGDWAVAHGISLFKPSSPDDLIGKIEDLDLILTIGYGVLLPERILTLPKHGFLNLHFSLLPAYRGAAPAQRALQNGEVKTGVSVFQLDKGMDTGPIYSQATIDIQPSWRSVELLNELAKVGVQSVSEALQLVKQGQTPTIQSGNSSIAPKISKAEAKIDFTTSALQVVNAIRAFTYEPGAWTTWKGEPFKITSAQLASENNFPTGTLATIEGSVFVGTKDGAVEILTVIPSGKKEMTASEWARGARLSGGELLG
jgi:methionyl-tRNA formyltransferase